MEHSIEALDCPNCGAPLKVKQGDEITFCEYCNSSVRIGRHEETGEHTVTHMAVPPEVIQQIKDLITSGKRDEALEVYMKASGYEKEKAEKMIALLVSRITDKIILNRPLSAKGVVVSSIFFIAAVSMVYLIVSGVVNVSILKVLCWVVLVFALLNFVSLWRSLLATFKFMPLKWNQATIQKFIKINENKKFVFFRLLLEVKEPNGQTFRAESNVMVKHENASKMQEGKVIDVKYSENDKTNILASVGKL